MPAGRGKKPKRKASSKQSSKRVKLLVERSSQPHTYRVQQQRLPTYLEQSFTDLDEHSQPTEPSLEYDSLEEQPTEPGLEYEFPASCLTPVFRLPLSLIPCGHNVTHNVSLPYSPLAYAPTPLPSATNMAPPSTSPNTNQQPFWLTFV